MKKLVSITVAAVLAALIAFNVNIKFRGDKPELVMENIEALGKDETGPGAGKCVGIGSISCPFSWPVNQKVLYIDF